MKSTNIEEYQVRLGGGYSAIIHPRHLVQNNLAYQHPKCIMVVMQPNDVVGDLSDRIYIKVYGHNAQMAWVVIPHPSPNNVLTGGASSPAPPPPLPRLGHG